MAGKQTKFIDDDDTQQRSSQKPEKPKWLTRLVAQFEALQDAGIAPRYLVISLPRYQELVVWSAAEAGGGDDWEGEASHPEAVSEWRNLEIVILPTKLPMSELTASAQDVWDNADDFLKTMESVV